MPANYVSGSIFENDPALPQPMLPALVALSDVASKSGEERELVLVRARRGLNKLVLHA